MSFCFFPLAQAPNGCDSMSSLELFEESFVGGPTRIGQGMQDTHVLTIPCSRAVLMAEEGQVASLVDLRNY